jgi:hypothetical protein
MKDGVVITKLSSVVIIHLVKSDDEESDSEEMYEIPEQIDLSGFTKKTSTEMLDTSGKYTLQSAVYRIENNEDDEGAEKYLSMIRRDEKYLLIENL